MVGNQAGRHGTVAVVESSYLEHNYNTWTATWQSLPNPSQKFLPTPSIQIYKHIWAISFKIVESLNRTQCSKNFEYLRIISRLLESR